ncbi:imelysin family protein [Ancylobacter terrae]|uniref:imelysin family protein n=1 Tax=Ancylobacter sp. sgz301288 TaxID=3342077 RepID=UPI003859278C
MWRSLVALVVALTAQIGQSLPVLAGAAALLTQVLSSRLAHADAVKAPDIVADWLLPRYAALDEAARAQLAAWNAFCKAPSREGLVELKTRFAAVSDAWAAVEFITFGPVVLSLRADRFNLFPERRNAVARSLAELIADPTEERLAPERFARLSAAVQGLPALERLLYDDGADAALVSGAESGRRCAIGRAVAGNLAEIAGGIRSGWGDRNSGLLAQLEAGKPDPVFFPDPNALLSQIVTDLAGAYQRVVDQRLLVVLGKSAEDAKPALADRRRSGRSRETVLAVVASAQALSERLAQGLDAKSRATVDKAGQASLAAVERLPADVGAAATDARGRKSIEAAVTALKAAQKTVAEPLASGLGVPLGFNALDGD